MLPLLEPASGLRLRLAAALLLPALAFLPSCGGDGGDDESVVRDGGGGSGGGGTGGGGTGGGGTGGTGTGGTGGGTGTGGSTPGPPPGPGPGGPWVLGQSLTKN